MANITSSWMDKPQPKGLHWDPRHHGLGVRVWANGTTKSWVFQKSGGRRITIGKWPRMEVNEARLEDMSFVLTLRCLRTLCLSLGITA